jgi:hypothetical protein
MSKLSAITAMPTTKPGPDQGSACLGQDLDEGHVEHHPRRETQGDSQKPGVGTARQKADGTADTGTQAGEQGETKGKPDILQGSLECIQNASGRTRLIGEPEPCVDPPKFGPALGCGRSPR